MAERNPARLKPRIGLDGPPRRVVQADQRVTRDFYEPALLPDEWALYRQARAEQGLSGEVALLRLRLHRLLGGRAEAGGLEDGAVTAQLLRIVDLLVKALRAHGSGASEEQAALERALDEEAIRVLNRESRK